MLVSMVPLPTARFASFSMVAPERQRVRNPPLIEAKVERIYNDKPVVESELPAAAPTAAGQHAAVTPPTNDSQEYVKAALKGKLTELRKLANVNLFAWNIYLVGSDQSGLTAAAASSGSLETLDVQPYSSV